MIQKLEEDNLNWLANVKIRTKLLLSFILIALLVGIVGILGIINAKTMEQSDQELFDTMTIPISQVGQISTAFQTLRVNLRDMIIANDTQTIEQNATKIAEQRQQIDDLAGEYEKTIQSAEMQDAFKTFSAARVEYAKHLDMVMEKARQNQDTEAFELMSPDGAAGKATIAEQNAISNLVTMKLEDGRQKAEDNAIAATGVVTTMTIVMIVSMVLAIALGLLLSTMICRPLKKAGTMIQEMSKGHFGNRLKVNSRDEIGEMSRAMDDFSDILQNVVIGTMNRISNGDVSINIEIKDPQDELSPALKEIIETIRALIAEANLLSQAAVEGKLSTRGYAEAFKGGYRSILEGVNETLDAVVGPLNVAADYVDRIGKGDIPPKITDNYNGDFNNIKNSINSCLDGLGALVEGSRILKKMSLNDYSEKMEMQAQGIYQEIGESINGVHARLLRVVEVSTHIANGDMSDLDALQAIGRRSDNDSLIPALVAMIVNITSLVEETEKMASTAVAGDLSSRGDAGRFPGEFAKVIEGFNQTLDAVIEPIQEASDILGQLSQGNLHTAMTGNYRGDHAKIKEDLNRTIAFLKDYVEEITATLEEMGRGNLDLEINSNYLGNFQAIKDALNNITNHLSATMSDINVAAGQVEMGSQQISDGGQALSQGTTEQASSIQELTASIEEVASETKRNAMNANEANELAINVRSNAEVGNSQMVKMITAMSEINESSHNISKIIKVIDDIAFQTNILALNAAVEAARAGQHGKGFAVVAEEVRTLAARSAEAAKETTGLIEGSIDKVDVGTKIADETAESLAEILKQIEKVTGLVGKIAQASNDQASEIAQITQGIEQVSQVVQTNSATAEESAAASEELSGQAQMLKQLVDAFKLKNQTGSYQNTSQKSQKAAPQNDLIRFDAPQIILDDWDDDKY
jgi:methyl-accepting chemotaxis protein